MNNFDQQDLDDPKVKKYPKSVESKDPARTPIFTPSMYCKSFAKAKFPTNKLIVKPIPVSIDTA